MILGHFPVSATRDSAPTPSAMLGNPGLPYFAWIDPLETIFAPEHLRWDENIFSFTLNQDEGDPASLTLVVRRPRNVAGDPIGLLGPGRNLRGTGHPGIRGAADRPRGAEGSPGRNAAGAAAL